MASSVGAAASVIGGASAVSQAIGAVTNVSNLASAIRSVDLPSAGEIAGDLYAAVAAFSNNPYPDDWRVRLSLPTWPSFQTSVVLDPLKQTGGLVFPYTPTIQMQSSATYNSIKTTHTNYNFQAFQHSDPGEITITAPMNVEDAAQGLYWIASLHYLRSLTKMFNGIDPKAGNPPPVVQLNAYGQYVFNNVPVVVKSFSTQLENKCDYISVPVVGSAAGIAEGLADAVAATANAVAGVFGTQSTVVSAAGAVAGAAGLVGQAASLAGLFGAGGSISGGTAHVPTKSTFTVVLQPMYSRNSARNFSLDRFVEGGYLNGSFGWI